MDSYFKPHDGLSNHARHINRSYLRSHRRPEPYRNTSPSYDDIEAAMDADKLHSRYPETAYRAECQRNAISLEDAYRLADKRMTGVDALTGGEVSLW